MCMSVCVYSIHTHTFNYPNRRTSYPSHHMSLYEMYVEKKFMMNILYVIYWSVIHMMTHDL